MNHDEQPFEDAAGPPPRRRRHVRWGRVALAAGLPAAAAAILLLWPRGSGPTPAEPIAPAPRRPAAPPPAVEIVPAGTTLSEVLSKYGFSPAETYDLWNQVRPVFDLQKVIAGHEFRFHRGADGEIERIDYVIDDRRYLRIDPLFTEGRGLRWLAGVEKFAFEVRPAALAGTIQDILINAVTRGGEKEILALDLAEIFAWDIDFNTEIRVGDSFRLAFEKNYREGRFAGYGEILAAEFVCQGRRYEAFRFVYPDTGKADHFDADGKSLRKQFLRSPIPYAHVTSRFSFSRLHPIYKVYTSHFGVDYGAPIGTPIQATADGTVTAAGWNGGAGNMVRLRHRNGYETMYFHLSRILVAVGAQVQGGQTIGLVGSTGDSTGPHLDYRILKNGGYLNPLGHRFDPVSPLRPEFKDAFAKEVERGRAMLKTAPADR